MFNFVGNLIGNNGARFVADLFSVIFGSVGKVVLNFILSLLARLWNLISTYIWIICKWVLGFLDMMQLAFSRLIGLDIGTGDTLTLGDYISGLQDITISGGTNYYDYILKIFKALFVVAIVLMIVFTIVAMVMQDYKLAVEGYQKADNSKGKFIKVIFANIITIFLIPLIFYTIIVGTNSVLTSFYRALGGADTTIAGNVLAAATYDANRYRTYANANKRIPITISVYAMENSFGTALSDEELKKSLQDTEVQNTLKAIGGAFANDSFLPFEKSTIQSQGKWSNYTNYSLTYNNTVYDNLGQYFENFICTREQYYVMADFVDFCQLYNINYYIKEISESDICWKYVDHISASTNFNDDGTAIDDLTLDITYRNAESINSPSAVASASSGSDDSYTLQISTKLDLTSPISDALTTASKLLGIDEDSSKFYAMERDDSGDYTNLVNWATRKVWLKLSSDFDLSKPAKWTFSDQIIVYEYFRFQNDYASTNNTLEDYTLEQLKTTGAYLDALTLNYRNYNSNTDSYSEEHTLYCVKINGNFYRIKEHATATDEYGHPYYVLTALDEGTSYFEDAIIQIKKVGDTELKLSSGFDVNNSRNWSTLDQILVYEYFKDLSLSNGIRRTYQFSDFLNGSGVTTSFPVYQISGAGTGNYVYINGTYYKVTGSLSSPSFGSIKFLNNTSEGETTTFGYKLQNANLDNYGLGSLSGLIKSSVSASAVDVDSSNAYYQKYKGINMKLSEDFSFYNSDTWTFRDYAIVYIYVNKIAKITNFNSNAFSLDSLKFSGFTGDIVVDGSTYYLKMKFSTSTGSVERYLDLEKFAQISELKITSTISSNLFENMGLGTTAGNLITSFNADLKSDSLLTSEVSSHTFYLSENFDVADSSTWTMGDYLFIYLIENNIIDAGLSYIKSNGYTALKFEVSGGEQVYYRFGKTGATSSTIISDDTFFLNETKIKADGYTVDKWFAFDLMSYILKNCYEGNVTVTDLFLSESEFGGGVVNNSGSYVYTINSQYSNSNNLQYALGKDIIKFAGIITDEKLAKYTYSNPALVPDNPTTWNELDTIIYIKTGELPTDEKPFESYLYNDDGYVYILVDDILVNISKESAGTCCMLFDNVLLTTRVKTNGSVSFSSIADLKAFYTSKFKTVGSETLNIGAMASLGKYTYYSSALKGATGTAEFNADTLYTPMDIALIYNSCSLKEDGYYTFEAFEYAGSNYIKLDDNKYLIISSNKDSYIYYQSNTLISKAGSVFNVDGTYVAFNDSNTITTLDSILYTYLKSTSRQELTIYECNVSGGDDYVMIDGILIKLNNYGGGSLSLEDLSPIDLNSAKVDALYDEFYKSYVSNTAPTYKESYSINGIDFTSAINPVADCISPNWFNAFDLILHKNDLATNKFTELLLSQSNEYYLKAINGKNTYYIRLTGIVNVSLTRGDTNTVEIIAIDNSEILLRLARFYEVSGVINYAEPELLTDMTISEWTNGGVCYRVNISSLKGATESDDKYEVRLEQARKDCKTSNLNNWTIRGLISLYLQPNADDSSAFYYERYINGSVYYEFKGFEGSYFIPKDVVDKKFIDSTSGYYKKTDASVTANSSLETILINNNLSKTGVSLFWENAGAGLPSFYYAKDNSSENYYAIYNLVNGNTGSTIQYLQLKKNSGSSGWSMNWLNDSANATTFSLITKDIDEIENWTMIDLEFNYITGSTIGNACLSMVYKYNGKYYIKYKDKYIWLQDTVSIFNSAVTSYENVSGATDSYPKKATYANITTSFSGTVIDKLKVKDGEHANLYQYKDMPSKSSVKTIAQQMLNTSNSYAGKKINTSSISYTKIEFSATFDVRDYNTWTISDYIIYYAFTNGYFGDANTSYSFPFVYTPTFMSTGSSYQGLTYLDILLAKASEKYEGGEYIYPYLDNPDASYEFNLVYDSSRNFYLEFGSVSVYRNGTRKTEYWYIPISDKIALDFTNMKVTPGVLSEAVSYEGLEDKFTQIASDGSGYLMVKTSKQASYTTYKTSFDVNNFQTFVNAHGAPAFTAYLLKDNEDTGSVSTNQVIYFAKQKASGATATLETTGYYFKYDTFYSYYQKFLASKLETVKVNELEIIVSPTLADGVDFNVEIQYSEQFADFKFNNYYYFNIDGSKLSELGLTNVSSTIKSQILNYDASSGLKKASINYRLSKNFDISNTGTWTILDYIIMYEYSRDGIRHNKFKDITIEELKGTDYCIEGIYYIEQRNEDTDTKEYILYLYLNNNFYNLTGTGLEMDVDAGLCYQAKKEDDGTVTYVTAVKKINEDSTIVTKSGIDAYDFKVLQNVINFSFNTAYSGARQITRNENNISYEFIDNSGKTVLCYRELDMNVANTNFKINTANFGTYSTSTIIKSTSWVEKLMNDMQVYYPDLNWGVLIATDGWLDTLGEFTSAYSSGLFTGGNNSSNTTAVGLVLSEFFMSVATEVSGSYANYEYSSIFDEETIHALMMSLMGEECYQALVFEAEVFMDYFNSCFAPIIDDFANEFGENIKDNSLRLNAYKSYLATLLLSSDIGEYLYTVATRVYAEYTIGEYLASAGDDYLGYYNYSNNLKDEDGNAVTSYTYGTFIELLKYENEYCGSLNPTFTFNFKKAFDLYKNSNGKVAGFTYDEALNNDIKYNAVAQKLIDKMNDDYSNVYYAGNYITDYGEVVDSKGEVISQNKTYVYCYMIHVYWAIKQDITGGTPIYLQQYKAYIDGDIDRWSIVAGLETETADQYYENYLSEVAKMTLYKPLSFASGVRLFMPDVTLGGNDDEGILDKIKTLWDKIKNNWYNPSGVLASETAEHLSIPITLAMQITNGTSVESDCIYVFKNTILLPLFMNWSESNTTLLDSLVDLIGSIIPADTSNKASWDRLNEYHDCLKNIISELQLVRELIGNETTELGSSRDYKVMGVTTYYTDAQIDSAISAFQSVEQYLNQYLIAQTRIDKMQKRSITFTLAQYGANYVSSGYKFSVKNKSYTFKETTDASRLAEYVYGGAFLEKVGVGAQYTASDFTGIIKASKVYDNEDKVMKTDLVAWQELRGFLSNIADKTAEFYYMTNLADLDVSTINGVKLTDKISNISYVGSASYNSTSIDAVLYAYIWEGLGDTISKRVTGASDVNSYTHERFVSLSKYIFSNDVTDDELAEGVCTFESFKRKAMKKVIDNEQTADESAEERANRYMVLFNLLGMQVTFYKDTVSDENDIGRVILAVNLEKAGDDSLVYSPYETIATASLVDVDNYDAGGNSSNIKAVLSLSDSTLESIKSISGLENRPTREVLTREYSGTRTGDYYDEAYGDTFIACTYSNGLYYPIIGTGSKVCNDTKYKEYVETDLIKHQFVSSYCGNEASVVIMKGIITADGYPTAIRKYNNPIEVNQKKLLSNTTKTYNSITYYRTNIGGNFGAGEDLVDASRAVNRVSTKNYTKYVYGTSFTKGIGGTTTYTGKTNLRTIVSSDYEANFVQSKVEYLISQTDDMGGISVLDEFSYFYIFSGQTWILLVFAFITIIPVLINAVGGAMSRILDLLILFLVSPIVISTNSLYPEGKNETYKSWKQSVTSVLLGVFGYIIAFCSFAIVIPIILNTSSFISVSTYNSIISIGGLGKFLTYPTVNSLVKFLWVVTAVSILEKMPQLLLPIITASVGEISSPDPGLGGPGVPFTAKAMQVGQSVMKVAQKAGSIVTGKALIGLIEYVKEDAIEMVPGGAFIKKGLDATKEKREALGNKVFKGKQDLKKKLAQNLKLGGETGSKIAKAVEMSSKIDEGLKKARDKDKKKRKQYKDEFKKNFL